MGDAIHYPNGKTLVTSVSGNYWIETYKYLGIKKCYADIIRKQGQENHLDDFEKLQNAHEKLKRQINCVKDHPEIKPLNCCWMADSLELRELRKHRKTG